MSYSFTTKRSDATVSKERDDLTLWKTYVSFFFLLCLMGGKRASPRVIDMHVCEYSVRKLPLK